MNSIEDILASLSTEDIDSIKSLADSLLSFDGDRVGNSSPADNSEEQENPFASIDPETLSAVMSVMSKIKAKQDDDRVRLIKALRPMLSDSRKKRADDAVRMISLFEILPELKNLNLF